MDIKQLDWTELEQAEAGSFYTILGAGGDLTEFANAVAGALQAAGISEPTTWYSTLGGHINTYVGTIPNPERDYFPPDLHVLMFSLEGIVELGKLAIFKLEMGDRWFDDIVGNMRVR